VGLAKFFRTKIEPKSLRNLMELLQITYKFKQLNFVMRKKNPAQAALNTENGALLSLL
jgi:hypothetical protein